MVWVLQFIAISVWDKKMLKRNFELTLKTKNHCTDDEIKVVFCVQLQRVWLPPPVIEASAKVVAFEVASPTLQSG